MDFQLEQLQSSLYNAISNSTITIETDQKDKEMISKWLDCYDHYKMSIREVDIYTKLGCELTRNNKNISILDVGSGTGMTSTVLLSDIASDSLCKYVSIDNNTRPTVENNKNVDHIHLSIDIFDDEMYRQSKEVLLQKFDIIMIDIEPHGCEIEVYEKLRGLMKPVHLCIFKHIAHMNTGGPYLADRFLTKYEDIVHDYFGEMSNDMYNDVRDLFVIISSDCKNKKDLKCSQLSNSTYSNYVNSDIKSFVKVRYK